MRTPTDNLTPPRSILTVLAKLPNWSRVYRHPHAWAGVLLASGSWNLFLGVLMLVYGVWLGLLPLAASAFMFWVGYRLHQITPSQPAASAAGRA